MKQAKPQRIHLARRVEPDSIRRRNKRSRIMNGSEFRARSFFYRGAVMEISRGLSVPAKPPVRASGAFDPERVADDSRPANSVFGNFFLIALLLFCSTLRAGEAALEITANASGSLGIGGGGKVLCD